MQIFPSGSSPAQGLFPKSSCERVCTDPDNSGITACSADELRLSRNEESAAVLPSNLKLPHKSWGIPIPALRKIAGAVMVQCISALGGMLSISGLETDEKKVMSPSQTELIRALLQPGDIILSRTPVNHLYYTLQQAAFGSNYSHAAVYAGNDRIIDSYESVKVSSVKDFCASQGAVMILRPPYGSEQERLKALAYLDGQIGKPYDWRFDLSDDSAHYCTEIVVRALEKANPDIEVPGRWYMGRPIVVPDDVLSARKFEHVSEFIAE